MRRALRTAAISVLAVAGLVAVAAGQETREKAAEIGAKSWLALVDAGRYGESWDAALQRVRAPLGKVVSRKLRGAKFMTEVPGAPAGEYVVIQYDTDLANRAGAIETITPMKGDDGVWRVSGYYIK